MPESQIFRPKGPATEVELKALPGIPRLFATLIALSLTRPSHLPQGTDLAHVRMVLPGFQMNPAIVDRFREICGYDGRTAVPAPFIQTLFIGVISRFISASFFPINPMGLIQVGQSFTMERRVGLEERLDLSCTLLDMTQTPRGILTRFGLEALSKESPVWHGVASYFTRAKNPPPKDQGPEIRETPLEIREAIRVPKDIGRKYAAVSRDYNPHHLYPWTARLIGFKQAIAHGIWSLARAGASLEKAFGHPERLEMEGALKLPIYLPAAITLGYEAEGSQVAFELRDQAKGLPHLKGTFRF